MKNPVAWHEENLIHLKGYLDRERQRLESHRLKVQRLMDMVDLAERQLDEAKRRGLEAFDSDRLCVNRKR